MSPSSTRRQLQPNTGEATILFLADLRDAFGSSHVWTIHDEQRRFRGELTGVSGFETRVPAGRHVFGASALRSGLKGSLCFAGEYEAGKLYVVWLRMSQDSGFWTTKWLFPRPGSKTINVAALIRDTPLFVADREAGQVFLDQNQPAACPTDLDLNPVTFGFNAVPR